MENFETAIEQLNKMAVVPQSIDFVVKDDFIQKLPQIMSNAEDLMAWAKAQTEIDKNLILQSDEDFENATKRCAEIRKVIKKIDSERINIKKAYNAPYEIFETKVKSVKATLQSAVDSLWRQIQAAEQAKKTKLESEYREYYRKTAEENGVLEYRTWEQIFELKWLTKSMKADTVISEINSIIESVKTEIAAIKSLNSEFQVALLTEYSRGKSITEVIKYNNLLISHKQAAERQKQDVETQKAETQKSNQPIQVKAQETVKEATTLEVEETFTIDFRVVVTESQLKALKECLIKNNIKYGKVPKE